MEINNTTVRTPYEAPGNYHVDWRHRVAQNVQAPQGANGHPQMRGYGCEPDAWIRRQIKCLDLLGDDFHNVRMSRVAQRSPNDPRVSLRRANEIFINEPEPDEDDEGRYLLKPSLEALLLCPELTIPDIAKFLNERTGTVKAYERVFFNVRDEDGLLLASPWLRMWFAKGDIAVVDGAVANDHGVYWKVLAVESGVEALVAEWNAPLDSIGGEFPEAALTTNIYRQTMRKMARLVRFGNPDARSLANIMTAFGDAMRDMRERGVMSKGERVSDESLLMQLLKAMSPQVVTPSEERIAAKQKDVEAKIAMMKQTDRGHGAGSDTLTSIGAQVAGINTQ
jgi:hypothetical protein